MTVAHSKTRQHKTSGRNDEKMVASHKQTLFSSSWTLESVRKDEVLVLHCELDGDCEEPDERHSERSRVSSELLQSAGDCQSEHARVLFKFHSCQTEDEGESFQVQDDSFDLPEFHSWSAFFGVFCFLASSILSSLAFHFAGDLPW